MQMKNPLQWSIQQGNQSLTVQLFGELTRNTLLPLWQQRAAFFSPQSTQPMVWDLAGLVAIDSAGFILLADLLNDYQKITPNTIINCPDSVIKLAELGNLSPWLSSFLPEKN